MGESITQGFRVLEEPLGTAPGLETEVLVGEQLQDEIAFVTDLEAVREIGLLVSCPPLLKQRPGFLQTTGVQASAE